MSTASYRPQVLLTGLLFASALFIAVPSSAQQRRVLPGRLAAPAADPLVGAVPSSLLLSFGLTLPLRDSAGLQTLVREQQDPRSPNYHRYLSREDFTKRFAPTQEDYDRVVAFAKARGFTVARTFPNRLLLNLRGSSAQIDGAFAVTMQLHQRSGEARTYYAPDVEPSIDSSLPILDIAGLSNRELPHPMLVHANAVHADTTGSGQQGQFLGSDMRAAYAGGIALDGTGQTVGLIELGPYNVSDVQAYFKAVNQPLKVPIYNILLDVDGICAGSPSAGGCDDGEEVIDMEQAISMAPGLSGLLIYEAYGSGSDALTAFAQAASDDVAKQLSLSFGFGGTPSTEPGYEQVFLEFAAQGQNLFIASGDSGANVGGVGYPGNSPNVTDVGGTDLVTAGPGGAWQSESAWIGSGGGWSTQSPIPGYQVPVINNANQGSTLYRNIPDIAMEANTDNFYCANGSCQGGIGGTSLAAPRWAGFLALANQQASGSPIGFLNNTFYQTGQGSSYNSVFHDIASGDNFNEASPNLFQAVPGYDLTSGWGSPDGQSMLNTLAPPTLAAAPNFTLSASPATLELAPGTSATSTVALSSLNGFAASVDLSAQAIGAPAGVTVSLGSSSVVGAGQTKLSVATSPDTPGGSFVVAVTGSSNGLAHTAYVQLALPDFTLSASPSTLYLNQSASAVSIVSIDAVNGFADKVSLSLSGLLPSISASFSPVVTTRSSVLSLKAGPTAPTSSGTSLRLSGTAGGTTRVVPSLSVAVSAGLGSCGPGSIVDLAKSYNLTAIHSDGAAFADGGLDGGGFAYSASLLTRHRVLNGTLFRFGAPDAADAIFGTGQTIALPRGQFNSLELIATGIDGDQSNQWLTINYLDGSQQHMALSFSDWFAPAGNVEEGEAVAMPYRNNAAGLEDARQFNVYSYTLLLDRTKTVESVTLPNNRDVIVLAATLSNQQLGQEVELAGKYNAIGIYPDGATFSEGGGYDGGGTAYSGNLLQDLSAEGEEIAVGTSHFRIAASAIPDALYGSGQNIPLPAGHYASLKLLGSAVQGDQLNQPLIVHYSDGSAEIIDQSFSDWSSPGGYANESPAVTTAYRDNNDGTQDAQAFHVYLYTFRLDPLKHATLITLPNNRNVVVLAMTLAPPPLVDLEPLLCQIYDPRAEP